MGEYRGRCYICKEPQQLLDEEDEPILCSKCYNLENWKVFNELCNPPCNLDVVRWNNLNEVKNRA